MGELAIDKLLDSKFSIEVGGNNIVFHGCIDLQDPEPIITPFFDRIHNQILNNNVQFIILNFTDLNFLNSSGIKTITKWIMKIPTLPPNKKYKMKLIYSDEITWQRTSLMILSYLAPGFVEAISS